MRVGTVFGSVSSTQGTHTRAQIKKHLALFAPPIARLQLRVVTRAVSPRLLLRGRDHTMSLVCALSTVQYNRKLHAQQMHKQISLSFTFKQM